jgi:hypothetical protein
LPLTGGNGHPPPDVVPGVYEKTAHDEVPEQRAPVIGTKLLIIPLGLAISCIAHLVLLTPAVYFAGANLFDPAPADAIAVDIVSPEEAGEAAKPEAAAGDTGPSLASGSDAKTVDMNTAGARPATAPGPPDEPTPQPRPQSSPAGVVQQDSAQQAAAQALLANPATLPTWLPQQSGQAEPEPAQPREPSDMFAMPLTLPGGRVGYEYQGAGTKKLDLAADTVVALRKHLKTCSIRPPELTAKASVTLRINLNPDGTLVRSPENPHAVGHVEGVLNGGGGQLFTAAIAAVRKCQPYKMLPPDKYEEWRTLDITFTQENF